MIKVIKDGTMNLSILTAAQARSQDGKGRVSLQGFLSREEVKHGKKTQTVVHEYSVLRPVKPTSKAGHYAWCGVLVLNVDEKPSNTHVSNGVTYMRHNARIVSGGVTSFEEIPEIPKSAMPF